MNLPARLASLLTVLGVLLLSYRSQAAVPLAWSNTASYPKRSNGTKIIASTPFDKDALNTGINRDDCFDTNQNWLLYYDLASTVGTLYIDIYAKTGDTSANCEDVSVRPGGTAQTCYLIRRLTKADFTSKEVVIHPYEIIAAVYGHLNAADTSAVNPTTAKDICASDKSGNSPLAFVLWSTPFIDETTVATGNSLALQTSYDISGPAAPTGLTLGAGNTIINAHFDSFSSTAYPDFKGMRAYCWPRGDYDAGGVTTDASGSDTAVADTAVADTAAADTASADIGASDADDASGVGDATGIDASGADDTGTPTDTGTLSTDTGTLSTDTGGSSSSETSSTAPTGICPANIPFTVSAYPPAGLNSCDDSGQLSTELTLKGLTNLQPYAVAIATYDNWGNSGVLSDVKCITPKETVDFFDAYKGAGGTGGGGYCAFNGSNTGMYGLGLSALGLALVGRLARRRNSTRNGR